MSKVLRIETGSAAGTKKAAAQILRTLRAGRTRPRILALSGELGSGKTTFIQGLARALGIRGHVQSPTFVLVRTHLIPKQFHQLHHVHHFIHIDAYRLETLAEARHLGLREALRDRDAVIAVEWADQIRKLIPRGAIWLRFTHGQRSSERVIKISNFQ